jgi:Uma2 family endonuclease
MPGHDEMRPAGTGVKLTYADFVLFPDDGKRHELIDGEHYVSPSPSLRHQIILGHLYLLIGTYLDARPVGRAFMAPLDTILSRFDVVEPDLLFVSRAREPELLGGQWVTGAPDLVVEIGSPSTRKRDETIKRRLYERTGVSEYWMIDPEVDVIRVYRRAGDTFEKAVELSLEAVDVLTTPLLPDLAMPLTRIFRD